VSQDVFLFAGTIRDNIMYGNINATEEEMIEAAKNAEIHDFIMSLENDYDTDVGERGIKLSGGQKQRISIARVFLKNPAILILDEATSALDNETEFKIQKALEKLSKGRTSLIIAHRLTTIKHADEIIVINKDGIKETGTHEKLLKQNGTYSSLYRAQYKGFIPDEIDNN
jgi:ATP-binding cassette subfamily B protein